MIVGDHLIFRNGLSALIKSNNTFKVINQVNDIPEAASMISNNKPDVLLIDSNQVSDASFKEFLSAHCEDVPTIILTGSTDALEHQNYLLLGASGVVSKIQNSKVLFKAIEKVHSDDLWFKREVMKKTIEKLIKEKRESPKKIYSDKYADLTDREREVLLSVCKGKKNKEIASDLFITETTVRHHLTSIFEKLNVKSRLALAIMAFNEKLVDVPAKEIEKNDL